MPDALVEARAAELWDQMLHSLQHRGLSKEAYLQISGRSETEILDEAKPDAERALKREAVLAAIVVAEGIEPSDEELPQALAPTAEREGVSAAEAARARAQGRHARHAARGRRDAQGDGPAGRAREADPARAG